LTAVRSPATLAANRQGSGVLIQTIAGRIILLWGWRRLLVAFLAGAASALAFAPFNAFPILWVTVPVFVWLLDGAAASGGGRPWRSLGAAGMVGWAFGFGFFLAGLWWVGAAFLVDAGAAIFLLPVAVLGLAAGLALFWAGGAMLARVFATDGPGRLLILAAAMTIAEYARGHLLTGFPWNAFGYALTPFPVMMQSASLVGIWGLTLAAFLVFAAPAVLADISRRGRIAIGAIAVVLLAAHVGFGLVRLAGASDATAAGVQLRIVQPSIPQDERWSASSAGGIIAQYAGLSRSAPKDPSAPLYSLLVWPESAFPFYLTENAEALAAIAALLPPGTVLVTGAARRDSSRAPGAAAFNSVYVIADSGEIVDAYDKVHLVPFGEYLPGGALLEAIGLRQMVAIPGGFAPGSILRTLTVPGVPAFGPLICYEVIFPGAVHAPGERPAWLLNVTNDAWYGRTPGPYQHLLQAQVRAVEEGLPLVRAANSGISAVVDAYGRTSASLGMNEVGVIDATLPAALPPTLYATFGDLVLIVMLAITAMGAILCQIYLKF
jgi:apolipoprotein N-acyltransferase